MVSLAEGARVSGRIYMHFGRGRRASVPLTKSDDDFDRLLTNLLAANSDIRVYETRFGTTKKYGYREGSPSSIP
jgi:hypothetical protein